MKKTLNYTRQSNDQGERRWANDSQLQPTCDPAVRSTALLDDNNPVFRITMDEEVFKKLNGEQSSYAFENLETLLKTPRSEWSPNRVEYPAEVIRVR